ncbi:hypothetical protein HYX01_00430 [Candidatus Woesearchaeota archaeon]|nr:hypothetical protein [Candidatus Woesearchaeota archaeon]
MTLQHYKLFDKRGVSPLIATVLLISFAVALGAVVMNWSRNLDISKPNDKCADVSIKMRNIGSYEMCYSGSGKNGYINFIISNDGKTNVEGISIWFIGEKGTRLSDFDQLSIKKGEILGIKDKSVPYDFGIHGKIKQVQFIPKIKVQNSTEICSASSIKVAKIGICGS